MDIPNDSGKSWRLEKFIDYHSFGDADMNFPLLVKYADHNQLTQNQRFWLAFLYSTCYCVPTTIFLHKSFPNPNKITPQQLDEFWVENKPKMIFQSDKRYVKNMNWFVKMVKNFLAQTKGKLSFYFFTFEGEDPEETYHNLYKEISKWQYYGRFTTFLLIEAIDKLTRLKADTDWFDWKKGNTATSGMMHLLYLDEEAKTFDASGAITREVEERLSKRLTMLKTKISDKYPHVSTNISDIETSLCGFRKLFKQSRYGGYYIDRVQEEIQHYEKEYPELQYVWDNLWEYRRESFPEEYLGELQGWSGRRKHLNSDWVEGGITGVEKVASKHKGNKR